MQSDMRPEGLGQLFDCAIVQLVLSKVYRLYGSQFIFKLTLNSRFSRMPSQRAVTIYVLNLFWRILRFSSLWKFCRFLKRTQTPSSSSMRLFSKVNPVSSCMSARSSAVLTVVSLVSFLSHIANSCNAVTVKLRIRTYRLLDCAFNLILIKRSKCLYRLLG